MPEKTLTRDAQATRPRLQLIQGGKKPAAPPETESPYKKFEQEMMVDLAPVGPLETQLATMIIGCLWRRNEIVAIESRMFAAEGTEMQVARANLETFLKNSRYLAKMALYEEQLTTERNRYSTRLLKLQKERREKEQLARQAAMLILRQAIMEGATPDPQRSVEQDGFVFSIADLLAGIAREEILRSSKKRRR